MIDEADGGADLGAVLDVERGAGGALDMLVLKSGERGITNSLCEGISSRTESRNAMVRMRLPEGLTSINAPMNEEERKAQQRANEEEDRDAL